MESKNHHSAGNKPMQLDNRVIPWKSGSSSLVSLLDMIKFCAEEFWDFVWGLEALFKDGILDASRSAFTPTDVKIIEMVIDQASCLCKLIELENVSGILNQIEHKVKNLLTWFPEAISPAELGADIYMLRLIIEKELSKRLFMYIPLDQAQWYEKKDTFGLNISNFAGAYVEIKEAANCYATDRYIACVFHAMRALEHGLRALAKHLQVDFGRRSWGKVIDKKIEPAIKNLFPNAPQTKSEIEEQQFLSQAAIVFRYFKDAWRNHVSHNLANYDRLQALSVLNHVIAFMAHLSTKLKE